MAKNRYQYFAAVRDPNKPRFNRTFEFQNTPAFTDVNGTYHPAENPIGLEPDAVGIYTVDVQDERFGKAKLNRMLRVVEAGVHPVLGPFDSREDAAAAEIKVRPKTDKQKVDQAEADAAELDTLRREKLAREKNK